MSPSSKPAHRDHAIASNKTYKARNTKDRAQQRRQASPSHASRRDRILTPAVGSAVNSAGRSYSTRTYKDRTACSGKFKPDKKKREPSLGDTILAPMVIDCQCEGEGESPDEGDGKGSQPVVKQEPGEQDENFSPQRASPMDTRMSPLTEPESISSPRSDRVSVTEPDSVTEPNSVMEPESITAPILDAESGLKASSPLPRPPSPSIAPHRQEQIYVRETPTRSEADSEPGGVHSQHSHTLGRSQSPASPKQHYESWVLGCGQARTSRPDYVAEFDSQGQLIEFNSQGDPVTGTKENGAAERDSDAHGGRDYNNPASVSPPPPNQLEDKTINNHSSYSACDSSINKSCYLADDEHSISDRGDASDYSAPSVQATGTSSMKGDELHRAVEGLTSAVATAGKAMHDQFNLHNTLVGNMSQTFSTSLREVRGVLKDISGTLGTIQTTAERKGNHISQALNEGNVIATNNTVSLVKAAQEVGRANITAHHETRTSVLELRLQIFEHLTELKEGLAQSPGVLDEAISVLAREGDATLRENNEALARVKELLNDIQVGGEGTRTRKGRPQK